MTTQGRLASAPAAPGNVRSPIVERIGTGRLFLMAFLAVALVLVLTSALGFAGPRAIGIERELTDFDAFHTAGVMALEGKAGLAYRAGSFDAALKAMSGTDSFMPWTYPPPFTLAMTGLAHLPLALAYMVFTLASLAFYLLVLHRIAGRWLPGVIIAILPAIVIGIRTGQTGFLVGGLVGAALLGLGTRRTLAGLPLGLLVIKPHLGAGVGLAALLSRGWHTLALAAAVALTAMLAATLAFGPAIWLDFTHGVEEAGMFLSQGLYLMFRMNSLYATLDTLGLPPRLAMAGQILAALAALGLVVAGYRKRLAWRLQAALAAAATLFVSPYGYDYDLTILGVALAFVLPDLAERCSGRDAMLLLGLAWLTSGYGLAFSSLDAAHGPAASPPDHPALIAPLLAALCLAAWRLLHSNLEVPAASPTSPCPFPD